MSSMPDVAFEDGHATFHFQDCICEDSNTPKHDGVAVHHVHLLSRRESTSVEVIAAARRERAMGHRQENDAAPMTCHLPEAYETLIHGDVR